MPVRWESKETNENNVCQMSKKKRWWKHYQYSLGWMSHAIFWNAAGNCTRTSCVPVTLLSTTHSILVAHKTNSVCGVVVAIFAASYVQLKCEGVTISMEFLSHASVPSAPANATVCKLIMMLPNMLLVPVLLSANSGICSSVGGEEGEERKGGDKRLHKSEHALQILSSTKVCRVTMSTLTWYKCGWN